jgi:PIN domain nuclease of toxin-antitoxin system
MRMRLLLDTHVFLWYISADARLSAELRDAIRDPANEVHLSAASIWEAVIKHALGKLPLAEPPASYLPAQRKQHRILDLSVDEGAMPHLTGLPPLHRDPFDRILVAQTLQHGLTLASTDAQVRVYPVPLLPAREGQLGAGTA